MSSRRVGGRCMLNMSSLKDPPVDVVCKLGEGCRIRCRPRHLTMVQNYEVRHQKPWSYLIERGHIGLYARRPVRCVPLTATHCRLRLTWREHALWTPQQWSCVIFSDESRFNLQSDSHRTLIWRVSGTRYHQENTIERHRYGRAGWLVWGGIILGSRTDLHVQSVTKTGPIYRDVILGQHVRMFRGAMGAEFLFMDDNARPHRANVVDECLQSEDITRMDWPAYSPDLNPIEHVWDMLGRRIAARQSPPTCLPELRRALLDEWCNIPQDQIDKLILSMPRRYFLCGIRKTQKNSTVSLEEFIALNDDNVCAQPTKANKDILEFLQSSKNIIDEDSYEENEMNNAASVPKSSKIRTIMKSTCSYLEAYSSGERNKKNGRYRTILC
ncbi:transposable element Tc3 transposase [Trichonephila clavipes]|uniref:Transposable element Tc3 transposase n=1 Tax=Trichonephila clavipes TaxID=2585209 RepID=A0A8X6VZ40_TRICX|nr:transposable element Tc3 transposase [Trichonephila clavipes]